MSEISEYQSMTQQVLYKIQYIHGHLAKQEDL
jgi:hypothetical protein